MFRLTLLAVLATACKPDKITNIAVNPPGQNGNGNTTCVRTSPCADVKVAALPKDTTVVIGADVFHHVTITAPAGLDSSISVIPIGSCLSSITVTSLSATTTANVWRAEVKSHANGVSADGTCGLKFVPKANINASDEVVVRVKQVEVQPVDTTITQTSSQPPTTLACGATWTVTWNTNPVGFLVSTSSSNTSVLTVTPASTTGTTATITVVGNGTATVNFTLAAKNNRSFAVTLTGVGCGSTTNPTPSVTFTLPPSIAIACSATPFPITPASLTSGATVVWTIQSGNAVTYNPTTGLFTVVAANAPGNVVVRGTASLNGYTSTQATTTLVVGQCASQQKSVLVIEPVNYTPHNGAGCPAQSFQLTYHTLHADNSTAVEPTTFSIISGNSFTVTSGGMVTTVAGTSGTTRVRGTLNSDQSIFAEVSLTTDNQACGTSSLEINISPPGGTCSVGMTIPLTLTITPGVTPNGTWSTSNSTVGTVTKVDDLHATFNCLSVGVSDAVYTLQGKVSKQTFTVNTAPQASIVISGPSTLTVGMATLPTYTATVSNSTDKVVIWSTTNTALATINPETGAIQNINAPGTVNVCAVLYSNRAVKSCMTVTINPKPSTSIAPDFELIEFKP